MPLLLVLRLCAGSVPTPAPVTPPGVQKLTNVSAEAARLVESFEAELKSWEDDVSHQLSETREKLEREARTLRDSIRAKILAQRESADDELEFGRAVGNFDRVIVNDDLEVAFAELDAAAQGWYPQLQAGMRP